MGATDQPPPFKPPEGPTDPRRPRFKPQFSMATLMGTLTLCALFFGLVATLPRIAVFLLSLAMLAVQIAFVSALLAGAMVATNRKRVFCVAAFASFVLVFFSQWELAVPMEMYPSRIMNNHWIQAVWVAILGTTRIGLALLGGWVALVAARYWQPE